MKKVLINYQIKLSIYRDLLENTNPLKVRNKIVKLYEYQIITLLKECLSVIVVNHLF